MVYEPLVVSTTPEAAEEGDRAKYAAAYEPGATLADLQAGLIQFAAILGLIKASDMAANPAEHRAGIIDADGALTWALVDINSLAAAVVARLVPPGGDEDDLLGKQSNTDFDIGWVAAPTGGESSTPQRTLAQLQAAVAAMLTANAYVTFDANAGTLTLNIPNASDDAPGLFPSSYKIKVDGIAAGAQVNVPTNITITQSIAAATIASSTGGSDEMGPVTERQAGLQIPADKIKLDAIELARLITAGGTQGQIFTKIGAADFAVGWRDPASQAQPTQLTGSIVSFDEDSLEADFIIAEPSAAATWSAWTDIPNLTYTVTTAGIHLANVFADGMLESQLGAAAWEDYAIVGGGDRAAAEFRVLRQTKVLGEVFNYVRNVPVSQLTDAHHIFDSLTLFDDCAVGDVIKAQARYQQQLIGSQPTGGTAVRDRGRLRFQANHGDLRILNLGEVAHHNRPPPTHQVYLLFEDASSDVPTAAEYEASAYESETGSLAITDRPTDSETVWVNIWSEDQLSYIARANHAPRADTNLISEYTEGRLVVDGVNGYTYRGEDMFNEAANTTWTWRAA